MKRFLMLIPLVLSLAILFSAAERTNIKPHYTADIAVSEQGNILLANKGTQELRMISSEGKLLKSWELAMPATGVATFGGRYIFTFPTLCPLPLTKGGAFFLRQAEGKGVKRSDRRERSSQSLKDIFKNMFFVL